LKTPVNQDSVRERNNDVKVITGKQREQIAHFFEHAKETARNAFNRDGHCVPVAVFLLADQEAILPLGTLGPNKDVVAAILKKAIEKTRPLAFVMVTEVWMAKARPGPAAVAAGRIDLETKYRGTLTEEGRDGMARPKEGVMEAVMVQCSAVTGENFALLAEIDRSAETPALKPWGRMDNSRSVGRFIFDVVPLVERQ
jgi:hypothetical protein